MMYVLLLVRRRGWCWLRGSSLSYRLYISRDDLIEVIKELALLPICTPNV